MLWIVWPLVKFPCTDWFSFWAPEVCSEAEARCKASVADTAWGVVVVIVPWLIVLELSINAEETLGFTLVTNSPLSLREVGLEAKYEVFHLDLKTSSKAINWVLVYWPELTIWFILSASTAISEPSRIGLAQSSALALSKALRAVWFAKALPALFTCLVTASLGSPSESKLITPEVNPRSFASARTFEAKLRLPLITALRYWERKSPLASKLALLSLILRAASSAIYWLRLFKANWSVSGSAFANNWAALGSLDK